MPSLGFAAVCRCRHTRRLSARPTRPCFSSSSYPKTVASPAEFDPTRRTSASSINCLHHIPRILKQTCPHFGGSETCPSLRSTSILPSIQLQLDIRKKKSRRQRSYSLSTAMTQPFDSRCMMTGTHPDVRAYYLMSADSMYRRTLPTEPRKGISSDRLCHLLAYGSTAVKLTPIK